MLDIKILENHKSIEANSEFSLPDFSVLTGKNGSGKTHLLEAMADNRKSQILVNGNPIGHIKYIGFNGLNPNIQDTCEPNLITSFVKHTWNNYYSAKQIVLKEAIPNQTLDRLFIHNSEVSFRNYVNKTIAKTKKNWDQLTEDDFADHYDISLMGQTDFFSAQFALIFKNYHRRQEENSLNEFYELKGHTPRNPVLNKNDFEEKFGTPPWDFVNKILRETNIPYEVNNPLGTRIDSNFTFILKDRNNGIEISHTDLSTGEKILMSLALAIYNTEEDLKKPQLLLLDEPDAGLHPSMSKKMVDILNKNMAVENKIPVVITTHSPTTIIASEGISIYQMTRGNSIPEKVPIQEAVETLSSEIPFLKISNDKRRQVFVESKYDVMYYERLTNIVSKNKPLYSEPVFLPARTSIGSNCTDVIETVNSLYLNGNDQVYGIIDWDNKNTTKDRVLVLGENDRYSIENYLLDPLLVGILLLRERKVEFTHFGITAINRYSELEKLTQNDAQSIVNQVLSDIGLLTKSSMKSILLNGYNLDVSHEFMLYQGHELEALYKFKYAFLQLYHKENSLKIEVIDKVINDYPTLIPINLNEILYKIK